MFLLVDTSARAFELALSDAHGRIERVYTNRSDERLSDTLHDEIRKLVSEPRNIEGIGVVTGPGSYTGLRVGITAANALGYALSKAVVGITLFALYRSIYSEAKVITLDNLHDLVYDDFQNNPAVEEVGVLAGKLAGEVVYGNLADEKSTLLASRCKYCKIEISTEVKMMALAKLAVEKSRGLMGFAESVLPLYINQPHITESKSRSGLPRAR